MYFFTFRKFTCDILHVTNQAVIRVITREYLKKARVKTEMKVEHYIQMQKLLYQQRNFQSTVFNVTVDNNVSARLTISTCHHYFRRLKRYTPNQHY